MAELTERAPLSQSRVSRLVAELETRGLLERSSAEVDGRGVKVSITPKGIEKFKAAQETHLAGLRRLLFSHLSRAEIDQLASITEKIIDACEG
jgi:DNA-binding MarR family transcriptional regulator